MNTALFAYSFPKELVAQHPLPRREDSRMMVINRRSGRSEHKKFSDISFYLREGDLLILNNAEADLIEFEGRQVPALPPYIKRKKVGDFTEEDYRRYRTVYAKMPGSKAAPTAGFHFTKEILEQLQNKGVSISEATLHVSYDTYKPIRTDQIENHPMHGEEFVISEETARAVLSAKKEGRRVIAVGTTMVRALESWALTTQVRQETWQVAVSEEALGGLPLIKASDIWQSESAGGQPSAIERAKPPVLKKLQPARSRTTLFVYPGFRFQIVDALLTNFHRPRSTVLVMVSAFAGREFILSAYEEAIRERYRLFSYGDCMLII